jgi:hypothetical protein
MRKLKIVPIIHTIVDMGSLKEQIKEETIKKIGPDGWENQLKIVNQFWTQLSKEVLAGPTPDFVYNDGLPICGDVLELKIVKELVAQGSKNHILLDKLIRKGAKLVGTESPELLLNELNLAKGSLSDNSLVDLRDKFIVERINDTLSDGKFGIIFIGLLHDIKKYLANDIEVI